MRFPFSLISLLILITIAGIQKTVMGQTPEPQPDVNEIVDRAAERSRVYLDTFRNLLSEETRTFQVFDKKGKVKKRREIASTFLVYQSARDEAKIAEYRNVTAVDGEKLSSSEDRAKDFFEKVAGADTSEKELTALRDESTRYDPDFAISGLTLFQAIPLSPDLRKVFAFKLLGTDTLGGHSVYVVSYEQLKLDPAITVNGSGSQNYDIEIDGKPNDLRTMIRGRLWIDTDTFNVRKEERTRSILLNGSDSPITVSTDTFEYRDTAFGILAPQRIEHTQFLIRLKDLTSRKDIDAVFTYAPFTRPDVDVKSGDVKQEN